MEDKLHNKGVSGQTGKGSGQDKNIHTSAGQEDSKAGAASKVVSAGNNSVRSFYTPGQSFGCYIPYSALVGSYRSDYERMCAMIDKKLNYVIAKIRPAIPRPAMALACEFKHYPSDMSAEAFCSSLGLVPMKKSCKIFVSKVATVLDRITAVSSFIHTGRFYAPFEGLLVAVQMADDNSQMYDSEIVSVMLGVLGASEQASLIKRATAYALAGDVDVITNFVREIRNGGRKAEK